MLGFLYFDPMYFLFLAPAILLAGWAQIKVKAAFAKASRVAPISGLTGAEAAQRILYNHGLSHVAIEPSRGMLSDHYDPRAKVLRLSPAVYQGRSLAALGVAAHEAGHAIQDAAGYAPLTLRNAIVPMAGIGSNMSWVLIIAGFFLNMTGLIWAGIALFSAFVLFQLVNLPVEFDASSRALAILRNDGLIMPAEEPKVRSVLNAAAMTYVAATLTAILQLLYFVMRATSRD